MSTYAKFIKEILPKKRKIGGETMMLTEECSAILQKKLPPKLKDSGSFIIPCIGIVKDTQLMLQFADRSMKHPYGVIEDVLVKVDKFIFPVDFVVLDTEEDIDIPLILERPFLATRRAMIDVADDTLILKVNEETVTFNILKAMEHLKERERWEELKGDEDESLEKKKKTPQIKLKQLPSHLKYVFLSEKYKNPAIICASLSDLQEEKLLRT
uniref:Uncharacterized protein LOC101512797 n=1 Tax=Cicer arietinum TaxID=3827 RepID=A0A1S2XNA3_CICAR|nr:uncharacterized protein LOC101512797 [Cicer arietinum]